MDDRAAFEAHMREVAPGRELAIRVDGTYWEPETEQDWRIWQAATAHARASTARECAELCESFKGQRDGYDCGEAIREKYGVQAAQDKEPGKERGNP